MKPPRLWKKRRLARRLLALFILALAFRFISRELQGVEAHEVWHQLRQISPQRLLLIFCLVAIDYGILSHYDGMTLRYLKQELPWSKSRLGSFLSYCFNFNFGSLVGGIGFRFRVYMLWGLEAPVVTQLLLFSLLTNWLGHFTLSALIFLSAPTAADRLGVPVSILQTWGALSGTLVASYILLSLMGRREFKLWRWRWPIPNKRLVGLQILCSCTHWLLVSSVIYTIWTAYAPETSYFSILSTHLSSAVLGAITQVPGGIGILEAVFVKSFSDSMDKATVVASLLCFRLVYYFIPLLFALLLYGRLEWHQED